MESPAVAERITDGKPSWGRWFLPPFVAALALDQLSKYWLFALPEDHRFPEWIERAVNPGVAWGMFHRWPRLVMGGTLLLIPFLGWVWWRWFRRAGAWDNLAFGLILGGALGNGWDRLLTFLGVAGHHGVRDFIRVDLHAIGIDYVWPNFNIADAAISVGFAILVVLALVRPRAGAPRPVVP